MRFGLLTLERGRHEDVPRHGPKVFTRTHGDDKFALRFARLAHCANIQAAFVRKCAGVILQRDDARALSRKEPRGGFAHVAEPLDRDARDGEAELELRRRIARHGDHAARGGVTPVEAAADRHGLARETTPRTVRPRLIETVSMTQAITCSLVPTSGAGTSRSGLRRMPISLA